MGAAAHLGTAEARQLVSTPDSIESTSSKGLPASTSLNKRVSRIAFQIEGPENCCAGQGVMTRVFYEAQQLTLQSLVWADITSRTRRHNC